MAGSDRWSIAAELRILPSHVDYLFRSRFSPSVRRNADKQFSLELDSSSEFHPTIPGRLSELTDYRSSDDNIRIQNLCS